MRTPLVEKEPEKRRSSLAMLAGAVLYGRRADDSKARKKAVALTASSFLLFFAYEAVQFGKEWIRHEWTVVERALTLEKEVKAMQVELMKCHESAP
jgi:hypothetical protein